MESTKLAKDRSMNANKGVQNEEKILPEKNEIFNLLSSLSEKQMHSSMFDYLKIVVSELGNDRSFYTTNFADVLWKCQQWKMELPNVNMFYAIKANPDPTLLRFLVILGSSFDCATEGEVRAALLAGANPNTIVLANPNVSSGGLKYAKKVGMDLIAFDSEGPLHRICNLYPRARLLIRLCPQKIECSFDFSEKYGCRLEDAPQLLSTARRLGMNVVGVSFHVGSLNTHVTAFGCALRDARQVFDSARSLGFRFSILDIGGGFLGSVGTDASVGWAAARSREALSEYFPANSVQVIAEPGCYVVSSAVTLTTTIVSKRTIVDRTDGQLPVLRHQYYLNNGIYSSFGVGIEEYGIYHKPLLRKWDFLQRPFSKSTLYGQTLCPRDVLRKNVYFPNMRVGESVVWTNMGAYSQSICSRFCGFQLPESRYVFRKDSRLETDWIKDLNEVTKFLAEFTYLIDEEDGIY